MISKASIYLSLGLWVLTACNAGAPKLDQTTSNSPSSKDAAPSDAALEEQYFRLADEAQEEVLGGKVMTRKELRKSLMTAADKNSDGVLDAEEKADFKVKMEEAKAAIKAQIVQKYDSNADGKLDKDEFKAAFDQLKEQLRSDFFALQEAMMSMHKEASEQIAAACGKGEEKGNKPVVAARDPQNAVFRLGGAPDDLDVMSDDSEDDTADADIDSKLDTCQKVMAEEREKMRAAFKEKFAALRESMAEIRILMGNLGDCRAKIENGEMPAKAEEKALDKPEDKPAEEPKAL